MTSRQQAGELGSEAPGPWPTLEAPGPPAIGNLVEAAGMTIKKPTDALLRDQRTPRKGLERWVARPGKLAMSRRARTWTVWTAVKPDMGLRMPGTRARTHAILILFIA